VVTDDILGPIGIIPSLAAGETQTLTANGNAAAGQYANLGTATGTPPVGPDVSDTDPSNYFGETPALATRTQGFWMTHTAFTSAVFDQFFQSGMNIGIAPHKGIITNIQSAGESQLFGAFYAGIPKKSDKTSRTTLDKARMQMLQQLVAAKLNFAATGAIPSNPTLIADADAAFGGNDAALIKSLAAQLDTYNNSGDNIPLPTALGDQGSATPKISQNYADIGFWDNP